MQLLDICLAIMAGLSQLGNAFMGWKVTGKTLSKKQQRIYDSLFILVGLIGIASIAIIAARSGRQERAHLSARIVNTFGAVDQTTNVVIPFSWLIVDKPLAFKVFF